MLIDHELEERTRRWARMEKPSAWTIIEQPQPPAERRFQYYPMRDARGKSAARSDANTLWVFHPHDGFGETLSQNRWPSPSLSGPPPPRVFGGLVHEVRSNGVVAELHSPDGDAFLALIPRERFGAVPDIGAEIECELTSMGSTTRIQARVIPSQEVPSLRDLGLDRDELREWAEKLDV